MKKTPTISRNLKYLFQLDFTIHGGANDNSRAQLLKLSKQY